MSAITDTTTESGAATDAISAGRSENSAVAALLASLSGRAALALPPLGVLGVIVAIWYGVHSILGEKAFLLPTPGEVWSGGYADAATRQQIIDGLIQTSEVTLTGLAIAAGIGMVWAVAMASAKWVERSMYPYAVLLQTIPILAIVPLIGVWFGYEFKARVVVTVMIALFPMVANTLFGLQSVERSQLELFRLQKAGRMTVLAKLTFPAALPAIFVGLRTSAGLAVVGAIVGDFFFQRGTPGLGSLLSTYARLLSYDKLFATIFVAAALGIAVFALFGLLSRLFVGRWYEAAR
ncbi:ABC transporter permease [Nocardioides fonticola]|uniref:ABC transporter permease n=1 Tax=Nocardioides fonticola TaxID=450363 RepID=A0ABP7XCW8_9ACTN